MTRRKTHHRSWGPPGADPVVLLHGGASHLPYRTMAGFAARLPGARLVTIPAGHRVHAAEPELFVEAVAAFLAE